MCVQRIVQYEPLLGMATLGLMLKVPVVSVRSILEVMNGRTVTDRDDAQVKKQGLVLRAMPCGSVPGWAHASVFVCAGYAGVHCTLH